MTTSVETNAVDSKFEVNSNVKFSGDCFVEEQTVSGKKVLISDEVNKMNNSTESPKEKGKVNGIENGENAINSHQTGQDNGGVIGPVEIETTTAENCKCDEDLASGRGQVESPSPAGGACSPETDGGGSSPQPNDNSQNLTESPVSGEHIDVETGSTDSGKSPKKKRGFLSGGVHIHVPKLSHRLSGLSFGSAASDVSATSTGSEMDGTPEKKKRKNKKDKKGKKKTKSGSPETVAPTPSECSVSVASEKIELGGETESVSVSLTDEGLHQPEGESRLQETSQKTGEQVQDQEAASASETKTASQEPVLDEKKEITEEDNKTDVPSSEPQTEVDVEPKVISEAEEAGGSEEKQSSQVNAESPSSPEEQPKDVPPSSQDASQSAPPSSDDQPSPSQVVEESSPEQPAASESEQSTANPGEVPVQQGEEGAGESEIPAAEETEDNTAIEGTEEKTAMEGAEDKTGATSSGDEGEEEDEGETDGEKQKKKKKRKGLLHNVHFPHFGGKKTKGGERERSLDQSSDSDRALSPKRFGWRKRKDGKSPERREQRTDDAEGKEAQDDDKSGDVIAEDSVPQVDQEKQDSNQEPEAGASVNVEIKVDGVSLTTPSASAEEAAEVRPEEKLLAECQELMKDDVDVDGGGARDESAEDFTSTDALLEEIAETITSIEKAHNIRASQGVEVIISASSAPDGDNPAPLAEGNDADLSLRDDIPAHVDEAGITIPSAQMALAVPKDGALVEAAEEEKAESQPRGGDEAEDTAGNSGEPEAKETQEGGDASTPEKEKSFRFKGKLHLPKFHLPKVHLSGKKDKKKNQAETKPAVDAELGAAEEIQRPQEEKDVVEGEASKTDAEGQGSTGLIAAVGGAASAEVQLDVSAPEVQIDVSTTEGSQDKGETSAADNAVGVECTGSPDADVKVELSTDVAIGDVQASASEMTSEVEGELDNTPKFPQELEFSGSYDNVDSGDALPERPEVIVVMNEAISEEESDGAKMEEAAEVGEKSGEDGEGSKGKPRKGRFKMPSLNFHMPKFGGGKKSYKVDGEVEAGIEDERVEGNINGIDTVLEVSEEDVSVEVDGPSPVEVQGDISPKLDAEVNAGNGDISVEPDAPDVDIPASNANAEVSVNVAVPSLDIPNAEQVVISVTEPVQRAVEINVDDERATLEKTEGEVNVEAPAVSADIQLPVVESLSPEQAVSVDAPEMEAQAEVPDVEVQAELPEVTVEAEVPQSPALDQEERLKAKRKGLSLPMMHFHRPKLGKRFSRHPRFHPKAKGAKSLGASGKVTTSLPDVAIATSSEAPLADEERMARRASDIVDPKVAAALASEHDITAAGDDTATPGKSWRGRFRFPSLHFSLPRFSSLYSPGKQSRQTEEEPEMTELKPEVEVDVTAEADIPKTNLDVVMPEVSATVASVPEVDLGGTVTENVAVVIEEPNSLPGGNLNANVSVKAEVTVPSIQADVSVEEKVNIPDISADVNIDSKGEVSAVEPALDTSPPEVEINAAIDVEKPDEAVLDTIVEVDGSGDIPEASIDIKEDVDAPVTDLAVESPDVSTDQPKKRGFFQNMHVPKLNMHFSPLKFKSKGKKGGVEAPDVAVGSDTEQAAQSPDLSMVVNTSGDPNMTVDGGTRVPDIDSLEIDVCKIDLPDVEVKKSDVDVKSPTVEVDVATSTPSDLNVDVPDVGATAEVSLSEAVNISAPDVNIATENAEDNEPLQIAGTVTIEYETIAEVSEPDTPKVDAEVEVTGDVKSPDLDDSAGATNKVLDLALGGGADVDVKVDGNVADVNISSEDEESDSKQKKKKKKKKRKGLHMPSINLPKFNLRHDKKVPVESLKAEAVLPDVVVEGEVDASTGEIEKVALPNVEIISPDGDINNKAGVSPGSVDANGTLEAPSEVVVAVALEVNQPVVKELGEQRELTTDLEGPVVCSDKDIPAAPSEGLDTAVTVEVPSLQVEAAIPKVELVLEETISSVQQDVVETVPDMSILSTDVSTDVSTSVPQVEISVTSADADVESPESSTTSKPSKTKKARLPKMHLPKMNFKFHNKSGQTNQVPSEDVVAEVTNGDVNVTNGEASITNGDPGVTNGEALSPSEIERIEESLPVAETSLAVPTVEVNGVKAESEQEEEAGEVITPSPSKKGKYRKRIGGQLKKMKLKGRGKAASSGDDIKGEGLAGGVSVEADSSADGIVALELDGADIIPDVTLESESPLLTANAELITSTPVKCKNNSAQFVSPPTTPETMNIDDAIAATSLQATPIAISPFPEDSERPFWVVVAIDFGTTFSGYAYSLRHDPDVHIMRKWEGGDPGVTNMKTPTTLLLTPEGEFHSFGFTARDFYHDMDHKEALRWLYFDKFKLFLHGNPDLNLKTEITAANGQKFPAITVFEHSLRFFHNHALEELQDLSTEGDVDPTDIRWVLTVPAIWKQPAKQFMRHAAYKAGLVSPSRPDQLLIALEPEAASIYIRKLRMRELAPEHQSQRQKWLRSSVGKIKKSNSQVSENIRYGTRYMVVDCGGGTVDITVHEVEEGLGTLKELHKAAGGRFGSVSIDLEFEELLVDIFGKDFIEEFKIKRPAGWVDLMIAFEARKRNASPWKNNPLNVSLPFSFIDYFKKYSGGKRTVEDAVRRFDNKDVKWSAQGMLRFTPEGMHQLFASTIDTLVTSVDEVLSSPSLTGISYLFIVGGFAQSALLQSAIRKRFSSKLRIIIPRDLGLSILKGAVLFGLDPSAVRVRRSRLTYGVGVLNKFQSGVHSEEKRVTKDGADWCKDIFDTFVQADESVAVGDKVTRSYTPAKPSQQAIVINIYCADRENVRFITDSGVRKCGTLHIDVSDAGSDSNVRGRRELQLTMQYGDTEIKVSALDVPTGKCVKSSIDFLNK